MAQAGGRTCFLQKSFQDGGGAGLAFRQELESDTAAKPHVLRLIHDSHATAAQFLQHTVMGDRLAQHGVGGLSLTTLGTAWFGRVGPHIGH